MVSELFYTSEQLDSPQKQAVLARDTGGAGVQYLIVIKSAHRFRSMSSVVT